ncbi:MAG TPA: nucleotide-binding domain containing protein, partial [Anaeromyxobacteraceae bacterium]|nr:nucleotide-binding domain containing protein [Anaeromyxobacteraceae bacterium]
GWPGAALGAALAAGRDVLLAFGEEPVPVERGPELAAAAARLVAPHAPGLGALIATGGDVARAVVGALGATGLHLAGEVEPGVPVGITDSAAPLTLVTKAGAFGSPETLVRARAALRAPGAAHAGDREEQHP